MPGGVVNLISKRPTAERPGEVQLQVGSYGRRQAAFDVGGALDDDARWTYRLTGLIRNANGMVDYTRDDRRVIAPALTWRPTASTSLTLLAEYQKNRRGQGYQALPRIATLVEGPHGRIPRERFVGEPGFDRFDQERTSIGYLFEQQLGERWTFCQNLRLMNQETLANTIYESGLQDDGITTDRFGSAGREKVRNLVLDNQLQWLPAPIADIRQTVIVGLDYQRLRGLTGAEYAPFPSLNVHQPVYGQPFPISPVAPPMSTRENLSQIGLYAQDQIKFGRHLAWTIGGRQDWTRNENVDLTTSIGDTQKDKAFTGRTGLAWVADNGWAPYVGYSRSFQPEVGRDYFQRPFKPQTAQQYEIGVRYQPAGQPLSLLASLYNLQRQNMPTADPTIPDNRVQIGEVRGRGAEFELKTTLAQTVDLIVAYAFNDVRVTRSNDETRGMMLSAAPRNIASIWASWRPAALARLRVGGGLRYLAPTYGDEREMDRLPSYTLADTALELDLKTMFGTTGDWRFAINVTNLFDRTHIATCGYFANGCRYGYGHFGTAALSYRW